MLSSAHSIASFKPNSLADFIQARGCFYDSDEITDNKEKPESSPPYDLINDLEAACTSAILYNLES